MHEDVKYIGTGEVAVSSTGIIKTSGIGSCIVVTLYDGEKKIGGMVHAMLPARKENGTEYLLSPKYTDEAIEILIDEIEQQGGSRERLKAKLIGGAKMFRLLSGDNFGIGFKNIESARENLGAIGILIESEDVGGTIGRSAELNLENGLVLVSSMM
jgi:chemotaxis protein CheD